jgi:ElaB/YqjD/DUF883 family membrane-anchored ribosome-binding protein
MAELLHEQDPLSAGRPRSAEQLRQTIAAEKELISETVEQMTEKIRDTMDWRSYVRQHPYLALGVAAGIGYVLSGLFRRRATPAEQIAQTINRLRDRNDNQSESATKMLLVSLATKAATDWLKSRQLQSTQQIEPMELDRVPSERGSNSPHEKEAQLII